METSKKKNKVMILMGSDSDLPVVQKTADILKGFDISYNIHISSAHRSPKKTVSLIENAENNGVGVIICAAGKAAHLAGVTAAHTTLPVLGIPMETGLSGGLDSLLSTVQMPGGIPVGTFGTGKSGATNAGIFAAQIIALNDQELTSKLKDYKKKMADDVEAKDKKLQG
ncbi:MAG: 5-(carboxyamino)imidazole ribonucleotide mutase [Spirochaetes bacterium]|nr:5-(carboxyamino)imidazole ribonucleotide mutase [Spirochaetota bacterium]